MFIKYNADKGKLFVRKEDGAIMGTILHLYHTDSINNYQLREATDNEVELLKERGITWN